MYIIRSLFICRDLNLSPIPNAPCMSVYVKIMAYKPEASSATRALCVTVGMAPSNVMLNFGFNPFCSSVHTPRKGK